MARYDVVLPSESIAAAFTDQVRPSVDRVIAAVHESRTLAALRDTLLPRLISGELRVPSASIGEVAHFALDFTALSKSPALPIRKVTRRKGYPTMGRVQRRSPEAA